MTTPEQWNGNEAAKERMRDEHGPEIASIENRIERAAKVGIDMSVTVIADPINYDNSSWPVMAAGDHDQVFAASINKLLLADCRLATGPEITDEDEKQWLIAMLKHSDNEAVARIKESIPGGAESVNAFARSIGLRKTSLQIRPDGSSHLGYTTADEAIKLLHHLLYKNDRTDLDVFDALAESTTRYGVRMAYRAGDAVTLLNKTGDYYGEDDEEVGHAVHHDAGLIQADTSSETSIMYGITTVCADRKRAWIANQLVVQTGADLLKMAGGRPVGALGRLGLRLR